MDEDLPDPTKIYFWECLLGGFLITVWQISCIVIAAISGDEGIAYLSMMLYFPMFFFVTSGVISSLGYGGTSKLVHGVLTTIIGLTFFTLIHILYIADSSGTSEIIHPSINFIMSCMVGGVLGSVLHIIVASHKTKTKGDVNDFIESQEETMSIPAMLDGIRKGQMNLNIKLSQMETDLEANTSKLNSQRLNELLYGR
jgi:uncharacterized membrane protein